MAWPRCYPPNEFKHNRLSVSQIIRPGFPLRKREPSTRKIRGRRSRGEGVQPEPLERQRKARGSRRQVSARRSLRA